MKNLDPTSTEYKNLKDELENNLYGAITKAVADGKVDLLTDDGFREDLNEIVDTIKAEAKVKKKTASKGSDVVKLFLAYIPKAMDRVRAGVFLQNMTDNQIINVLKAKDEEVDNFCAAVFEDEA